MISLIAAIGKNNEIGKNGKLLWNLPEDMKYFKETTKECTVVMGRNTFESLPEQFKPLPGRKNIVITRDINWQYKDTQVVHSIKDFLENIKSEENIFVIGGAQIYREMIPFADRLYITHVDEEFDADTFFPTIDTRVWKIVSEKIHSADDKNNYDMQFVIYKNKNIQKRESK